MSKTKVKAYSRKKQSGSGDIAELLLKEVRDMATGIYVFLIMTVFPLYLKDHYWEIGFYKWQFFLYTTLVYLAVMFVCAVPIGIGFLRNKTSVKLKTCDVFVALYGLCVLFTFFVGSNKQAAFMGAAGWYMGVVSQILFVLLYFVFSRNRFQIKWLFGCMISGSTVCFIIGILYRLGMDPFYLHYGMPDYVIKDFISTIGNRTWYSAYVCVILAVSVYLFCHADSKRAKLVWGIHAGIGFMALSASNSDSAYAALVTIFISLFILSVESYSKLKSVTQIMVIFFGISLQMCLLRCILVKETVPIRGFTRLVYDWKWMMLGLVASAVMYALVICFEKKITDLLDKKGKVLQKSCLVAVFLTLFGLVTLIVLNTCGLLEKWFHVKAEFSYLCFNDAWGDYRGWTWKKTVEMFRELPLFNQLFGVGADCYGHYAYSHPVYSTQFSLIWTDEILINSHNEWLNMYFCQGLIGGTAYLAIFVGAAVSCFRKRKQSHPLVTAVGLSVLAYMAHNFFCYQQVCATGLIFILLGMSQNRMLIQSK